MLCTHGFVFLEDVFYLIKGLTYLVGFPSFQTQVKKTMAPGQVSKGP